MKKSFIKLSALVLGVSLFTTGCRWNNPEKCEVSKSRIVFNLNISDNLKLNENLIDRIQGIEPEYTIKNGKINVIDTSYDKALVFFTIYNEMIENELKYLNRSTTGTPRSLNNNVSVFKKSCNVEKYTARGSYTETIDNAEFRISLQD